MSSEVPQTVEEVLALYAQSGLTPAPEHLAEAQQIAEQRRAELESSQADRVTTKTRWTIFVEAFNVWYPKFIKALHGIGDVLSMLAQTISVAFGVPIVLGIVLYVEQQRVYYGISLFEVHGWIATLCAIALVASNLILEMLISWVEHQAGYKAPPRQKLSLHHIKQWWHYFRGDDTTPRNHSPALRFKNVLRLVTWTILILALSGSMTDVIAKTEGDWRTAISAVLIDSSLLEIVKWIGGFVFALTVVLVAQVFSQYIAEKVIVIASIMESQVDHKAERIAKTAGMAAAYYMAGKFKEAVKLYRKAQQGLASAAEMQQLTGYSGRVIVPMGQGDSAGGTDYNDGSSDDVEGTDGTGEGTKTKIEQAIVLLKEDRTLRRLSTRKLQDLYPDIKHKTWYAAKQRLGIKQ
jgi:hypothetical protein